MLYNGAPVPASWGSYFTKPATLTVEDGKKYISFTLGASQVIQKLQTEVSGEFKDVAIISENTEANSKVVKFEIAGVSEITNATTFMSYGMTHDIQLDFVENSIKPIEEEQPEQPEEEPTPEDPEQETPIELEDGQYTIDFKALHATEDKASAMQNYLGTPATLTVEDGKTTLFLTIKEKEGQLITGLRLENSGLLLDGEIVSEDQASLSRVEKFVVSDISKMINAEVDMHVPAANYRNTQKFRLAFDTNSIQKIEQPNPEPPVEEEPNELESGEYTVDFNVLKNGTDSISVMDGYTEKPAVLSVEEAGTYLELTLKNSDWITLFQTKQQGSFVDAEVVSENTNDNTRVVRFPIEDVSQKQDVYTHVVIPSLNYDNYYTVQLKLDETSITKVTPEQPNNPNPEPPVEPEQPNTNEPEVVEDEAGNVSLTVKSVENLQYDEGKAVYELAGYTVNIVHISDEVLSTLNSNASLVISGKGVKASFPIRILQEKLNKGESLTIDFANVPKSVASNHADAISAMYDFTVKAGNREISEFEVPVKLEFNISKEQVNNWDNLKVVYINEAGKKAELITPSSIDRKAGVVAAEVSHFSIYGVFEQEEAVETPTPQDPNPEEGLADGEYTIDFTVLKNGTKETSVMDGYTVKPAKLTVKNKKFYATITLKNSDWIKVFRTMQNGKLIDAEVVKVDETNDTRDVRFEVTDLNALLTAYTEVYFEEPIVYDGKYYVQFAFDAKSIKPVGGNSNNEQPNTPKQPEDIDNGGEEAPENPTNPTTPSNEYTDIEDEDKLTFDRGQDDGEKSNESNTSKETNKVANTKTADTAMIGLFILLFGASAFVLIRKYRLGTL